MAVFCSPLARHSLVRWQLNFPVAFPARHVRVNNLKLHKQWSGKLLCLSKNSEEPETDNVTKDEAINGKPSSKASERSPKRGRKKKSEDSGGITVSAVAINGELDENIAPVSKEKAGTVSRRARKKATVKSPVSDEEKVTKKASGRKRTKQTDVSKQDDSDTEEFENLEKLSLKSDKEEDPKLNLPEDEDISMTYGWPPLVCCFGAAQHAFLPSGRPANRLIDHDIHEARKDMLWAPERFVRAPGGSSSSVAVALASIGGRAAFMGKLGDDEYGQGMLYFLNVNGVQTRSVCMDGSKTTAMTYMKINKRGAKLSGTCVGPCAEDCLLSSEINIDVLKEAKMFYFNSSCLLDDSMRGTTMQAIKIAKKFGASIFFDLNLPLPLWESSSETKMFIDQAWKQANFIEVTKQEIEFLCEIKPSEKFDTNDNDKSKFVHHKPEMFSSLWHENLKVLFVTNGTSKIHYYTGTCNGSVLGMEDPPITPFACDVSAAGDGIVAAIMKKFVVQPESSTDKGYLHHTLKYAINRGVTEQWIMARIRGFPSHEGTEGDFAFELNGRRSLSEKEFRTLEPQSP
ncbi:Fructokinase-like 2 [Nymphaea thermarum]|nr:Fructokinase-like 2 [Nymphaea thermarum]